jgi:hypothetical protein
LTVVGIGTFRNALVVADWRLSGGDTAARIKARLARGAQSARQVPGHADNWPASFIHQAVQCGAMSGDEAVEFA